VLFEERIRRKKRGVKGVDKGCREGRGEACKVDLGFAATDFPLKPKAGLSGAPRGKGSSITAERHEWS
jgi:hypothetical protein